MESDFLDFIVQPKDLSTENRPLRLRLDCSTGLSDDMLLPQRVHGAESICGALEYRILCVSVRAELPLKEFLGLPAALDFVTDRGGLRSVCGIITEAASGDSDGGLASYQLVLRDVMALLDKRINTRVFRNKTEVEIVRLVLDEWRLGDRVVGICFRHELADYFELDPYPKREFTMQHNESDGAFVRRLLKRRGVAWYFRADHGQDTLYHTMVLLNRPDSVREGAAGAIRYHRDNATEQRDSITSWSAVRALQPGSSGLYSWDYRSAPGAQYMSAQRRSDADQGSSGRWMALGMDDYRVLAPHAAHTIGDLHALGQLHMQRHDYETKCFHGEGSVRDLCVGEYFTLEGHPEVDGRAAREREFAVTALQLSVQNNLPKALAARVERLFARNRWMRERAPGTHDSALQMELAEHVAEGASRMHMQFTAVRRGVPIVPAYDPHTALPPAQMQSAIVVGPAAEQVHCDALGRVKIRFPATRPKDHAHADGSGAAGLANDSAWVRVASSWAGDGPGRDMQCGAVNLPRVGSEVLVAFLGGDPDKPVIVGQMYNQAGLPPALGTRDGLPEGRFLSGLKSREIHGAGASLLRFDDTTGQVSAQLANTHGRSELNLGYLTRPRMGGVGQPRGEGAELATDQHLSLRGGAGVLLSGWPRLKNDAQLERATYLQLMEDCLFLFRQLGDYAQQHEGGPFDDLQQQELQGIFARLDAGTNVKPKEDAGLTSVVGIAARDGINYSTCRSIVSYAELNHDAVARRHMQLTAGQRINLNAGRGISLFSHHEGLSAVAHHGKLLMQSQHDDTRIDSAQDLKATAGKKMTLMAEEIVLLTTGGAYLSLKGGDVELGGPGALTVKTDGHHWNGPATRRAELPTFTEGELGRTPRLLRATDGEPVAGVKMYVEKDGSAPESAETDAAGEARVGADSVQALKVTFYRNRE